MMQWNEGLRPFEFQTMELKYMSFLKISQDYKSILYKMVDYQLL